MKAYAPGRSEEYPGAYPFGRKNDDGDQRTQAFVYSYLEKKRMSDGSRPAPKESKRNVVIYIHGKGGSAAESEHYRKLFPDHDVIGPDYQTFTPWETGEEIRTAVSDLMLRYDNIILIANSIGAYFSMSAEIGNFIQKAYFISPIVDMEKLITDMMLWANVSEEELASEGAIHTAFGEDLSWEYLCYVRSHPVHWNVPTEILYGSEDQLTSFETIRSFAETHRAGLTVLEGGEHWFHTEEQMRFLDNWILNRTGERM